MMYGSMNIKYSVYIHSIKRSVEVLSHVFVSKYEGSVNFVPFTVIVFRWQATHQFSFLLNDHITRQYYTSTAREGLAI